MLAPFLKCFLLDAISILFYFLIRIIPANRNIPFRKRRSGKPEQRIQNWLQRMNAREIVHSTNRSSFKHSVLTCLYGNWNTVIAFTSYQNAQLLPKDFNDLQILYYFLALFFMTFFNFPWGNLLPVFLPNKFGRRRCLW